jgi:hypothetical protein
MRNQHGGNLLDRINLLAPKFIAAIFRVVAVWNPASFRFFQVVKMPPQLREKFQ